jgi:hypothetical protein
MTTAATHFPTNPAAASYEVPGPFTVVPSLDELESLAEIPERRVLFRGVDWSFFARHGLPVTPPTPPSKGEDVPLAGNKNTCLQSILGGRSRRTFHRPRARLCPGRAGHMLSAGLPMCAVGLPTPTECPTEGLLIGLTIPVERDRRSPRDVASRARVFSQYAPKEGDLRSGSRAGSGAPRTTDDRRRVIPGETHSRALRARNHRARLSPDRTRHDQLLYTFTKSPSLRQLHAPVLAGRSSGRKEEGE